MTVQEAKECIQGKLDCMNRCDVFDCKGTDECENCNYCYAQGTFGEQKKALQIAIECMEEVEQHRAFKEIFESQFSGEALRLLNDKDEFTKWLERGKWIARKCDELNKEVEKYRALGTVEELKEAREKQIPKKPLKVKGECYGITNDGKEYHEQLLLCPNCHRARKRTEALDVHCKYCGQALKWGNEE